MFSREAFLRNDDGRFSEATTAVDDSPSSSLFPRSPTLQDPLHRSPGSTRPGRYREPKRIYSLVRGSGSKDVRLVDKAGGNLTREATAENGSDRLGDYHIDHIELGRFSVASTAVNSPTPPPAAGKDGQARNISANLAGIPQNAQEVNLTDTLTRTKEEWSDLELDTKQFLLTVASQLPTATPVGELTANPSLARAIKARIKKTGRGLVIRLLQRLSSGDEEITDIHMMRDTEANSQVTRWFRTSPMNTQAPTVMTDETPTSPYDDSPNCLAEVDGAAQVYEMEDTSRSAESAGASPILPQLIRLGDVLAFGSDDDQLESSQMKLNQSNANCASTVGDNLLLIPHIPQLARKFSFDSADMDDSLEAAPHDSTSHKGKEVLSEVENKAYPKDPVSTRSSEVNHVVQTRGPEDVKSLFTERPRIDRPVSGEVHAEIESDFPDIDERLDLHTFNGRPQDQSQLWLDVREAQLKLGPRDELVFSNLQSVNTSESLGHDPENASGDLRLAVGDRNENRTFASKLDYISSITRKDISSIPSRSMYQILSYTKLVIQAFLKRSSRGLDAFINSHDLFWTIPKDHVRIRWKCKCGMKLFDDFIEKRPGAARLFEQHLNRPKERPAGSELGSSSSSVPSTPGQTSINNQSTAATSVSPPTTSKERSSTTSRYTPNLTTRGSSSIINASPFLEQLWVLACVERQKFATKLVHLDADSQKIRSDMELARLLKTKYSSLRSGWRQFLRLRGLATIQFVQFELHRSQVVDIRKCPDMPDKDNLGYLFFPSDLVPPVGERYLMHLFHHPEDYEDETITYKRIPKKRGAKLRVGEHYDIEVGWGIHLVEGFLAYKVWSFFTGIFVLVSVVFAVTWTVKRGDIQGAFGVAAYICIFATLFIGCCVAYLE